MAGRHAPLLNCYLSPPPPVRAGRWPWRSLRTLATCRTACLCASQTSRCRSPSATCGALVGRASAPLLLPLLLMRGSQRESLGVWVARRCSAKSCGAMQGRGARLQRPTTTTHGPLCHPPCACSHFHLNQLVRVDGVVTRRTGERQQQHKQKWRSMAAVAAAGAGAAVHQHKQQWRPTAAVAAAGAAVHNDRRQQGWQVAACSRRSLHQPTHLPARPPPPLLAGVYPQLQRTFYDCLKCGAVLGPYFQVGRGQGAAPCCSVPVLRAALLCWFMSMACCAMLRRLELNAPGALRVARIIRNSACPPPSPLPPDW